jgi:hypothetical protein
MMDDDAEPHPDALQHLTDRPLNSDYLYGSVAMVNGKLSWPMVPEGGKSKDTIYDQDRLPEETDVQFLPFLGW